MIQIDDSGSGSFLGGTCIGFYRPETNEYYFDIIPVELYDKNNFKRKLYLNAVVDIAETAFKNLSVSKTECIEVCRGYMFDKLRIWLADKGYCTYYTHITGKIQEVVEKNFEIYSMKLGLPESYIKYTRYPFHFHKLLRWVYADYNNRIILCKVGWKSWQNIESIVIRTGTGIMEIPNLFCLKCGNQINLGAPIKILSYESNQTNYVFIHDFC